MIKNLKHTLAISLAFVLLMTAFIVPTYAAESEKNLGVDVNEDKVTASINSIDDTKKQNKISDLYKIASFELVDSDTTDATTDYSKNEEITYGDEDAFLEDIAQLAILDQKTLDQVVEKRINDIVDDAKNNDNVVILPESYGILKQYKYAKEVAQFKEDGQVITTTSQEKLVPFSEMSEGSFITPKAASTGYEKSKTGKIYYAGKVAVTYKLTVQWFTNSSNKIFHRDLYNNTTINNTGAYRFSTHRSRLNHLTDGGRLLEFRRESISKKKLIQNPNYTAIVIEGEAFPSGKLNASASVEGRWNNN